MEKIADTPTVFFSFLYLGYILNPVDRYILACLDTYFVHFAQLRSPLRSFAQRTKCIVYPTQIYLV